MNTPNPPDMQPAMPVRAVADLARLSLSPEEEAAMGRELDAVLHFARTLTGLDLTDVPMTAHAVPLENVLRDDVPHVPIARETLLNSAPTQDGTFITVPPTFAQGGLDA